MITSSVLPRNLQAKVERELEPGERIQWMSTPIPRFFAPGVTGFLVFGILWTTFALFWTAGKASENHAGLANLLVGLLFVLIGVGMLSIPFWVYWKALRTVYVITDRRALTFDGGWPATIRSYPPAKLQVTYRTEEKDGSGDVVFSRRTWLDSDGDLQAEELGFLHIENPREVERMLKRLAEQSETR